MFYARVLGVAQDAGVPHVGCRCARCERHRPHPLRPASLGIVGAASYIVDATPAFGEQAAMLPSFPAAVLLTHLHMGHVSGLLQLGPEGADAQRMPVHATPAVCSFLLDNGPWELLVRRGNLMPVPHQPGERFQLEPGLIVESVPVPHRNEYGDTVAYLVSGPTRTLLYLPDIDCWEIDLKALLARCDGALLDGTFFSASEIGRQAEVPHPPIEETLAMLSPSETEKVRFTHINHTNPVLDESPPAVRVALQGERFRLGEPIPRPSPHATPFWDMD